MLLDFNHPRISKSCDCILISIDFDNETVVLQPIDGSGYEPIEFTTTIANIELPKKKMKAV